MNNNNQIRLLALVSGVICLAVYLRALGCGFVNWDDQIYILNNTNIRQLDWNLLNWAVTNQTIGWWMPLTWLSFAMDYHFWGLNPIGYHLTNIILHAANTAFVVLIANQIYRKALPEAEIAKWPKHLYPAMLLLAALLFGIHPLRVESVAWATERKDVLNGLFTLGAFFSYFKFADAKNNGVAWAYSKRLYLLSLLLFGCSLLSKQTSVVLPLLMIAVDWYPLARLQKRKILPVIAEKIPFLALSAAMSVFTLVIASQSNTLFNLTLLQRIVISGNALFEYVRLALFPVGIIPFYLIPAPIPTSYAVKSVVVTCCLMYVLTRVKKSWLLIGCLSFLIPLLPVMAFFQNGVEAFCARFTYLPSVGLSVVAAAILAVVYNSASKLSWWYVRHLVAGLIVLLLIFYGAMTLRLIDVWHDSSTFWTRVIDIQPFDRAYFYRGLYYVDTGNYEAAIDDYTACLRIADMEGMPDIFNIYAFRGEAFAKAGRYEEAISDFTSAITTRPHPLFFYHRAQALNAIGKNAEAELDMHVAGAAKGQMSWISP